MLATVIVVAVGMLAGVVVVAIALAAAGRPACRPAAATTLLVRVPGTDSFRGADATPDGIAEPGIVLYRFDAPLFFANADVFRDDVTEAVAPPTRPRAGSSSTWRSVSDMDSTATEMLLELAEDLAAAASASRSPGSRRPVAAYLERAGALRRGGPRAGLPRGRRRGRRAADDGAAGGVAFQPNGRSRSREEGS